MDKMPFRLNRFAAVDNTAIDTLTSLTAKGLLTHYIRARPGDRVDIKGLAQDHREGRKAISDAQGELMRNGYLVRFRIRLGRGAQRGRSYTWHTKFVVDSLPITSEDVASLISEIEDEDVVDVIRVEPENLDPRNPSDRGPSDRGPSHRGPVHRGPAHRSPVERASVTTRENTGQFTSHRGPSDRAPVDRAVVVKTESKTSDNEDETPSPKSPSAAAPGASGSGGEQGEEEQELLRQEARERAREAVRVEADRREQRAQEAAQNAAQRITDQRRRRKAACAHLAEAADRAGESTRLLCMLPDPPEIGDLPELEGLVDRRLEDGEEATWLRELLCTTDREAWRLVLRGEVADPVEGEPMGGPE